MVLVKTEATPLSQDYSDQWLKEWAEGKESFKAEVNVKPEDITDVKVDMCLEHEGKSNASISGKLNLSQKTKKIQKVPKNIGNYESNAVKKHRIHKKGQEADMLLQHLCLNAPVTETFSEKCMFNYLECNQTLKSWKKF